jgi:hypothetical protein
VKKTTTPPKVTPISPEQLERIQRLQDKKREEHKAEEEELWAMTYGPNWRTHTPPWAKTYAPREPVVPVEEPEPVVSEIRLGTKVLKRDVVEEDEPRQTRKERRNGSRRRGR